MTDQAMQRSFVMKFMPLFHHSLCCSIIRTGTVDWKQQQHLVILLLMLSDGDNYIHVAAAKALGSFAAHGKLHMTIAAI